MQNGSATILLVEDSPALSRVYEEFLRVDGHNVQKAASVATAIAMLNDHTPEAVILDLQLPDASGIEVLKHIRKKAMNTAVMVVTANGSVNAAVEAMREGAFDFLVKPVSAERLIFTVRNALERLRLNVIVQTYREKIDRQGFCGFLGSSLPMQAVYRTIESAAGSKASIFVTGESGTGKEVCAEAIHQSSDRAAKPFVAINCAAIPADLMESEIFGHVKGAFTGATADRPGAARRADGGTLFLDEICEMPLDLQVKLLRFIQTGTVSPVGGQRTENVDVRFVCATNRDPADEVRAGRFREDLFYRLHVIPISLPPLRERGTDILSLSQHFLEQFTLEERRRFREFDRAATRGLQAYDWPGNVRQLQNVVRRIVVLNDNETVSAEMLSEALEIQDPNLGEITPLIELSQPDETGLSDSPNRPVTSIPATIGAHSVSHGIGARRPVRPLAQVERDAIEAALSASANNVTRAAALLEISPSTIYRKMARWDGGMALMATG